MMSGCREGLNVMKLADFTCKCALKDSMKMLPLMWKTLTGAIDATRISLVEKEPQHKFQPIQPLGSAGLYTQEEISKIQAILTFSTRRKQEIWAVIVT
ncbi:hypothetical protein FQA39_LY04878 [Lamprigera yunnana]|nr:hypothetical protein FQA39_LY04878 [Lamprigera yunnana]